MTLEQIYSRRLSDVEQEQKMIPAVEIELNASELAAIAEELSHKDPALAAKLWKQIDAAQNKADAAKFVSEGVLR